MTKKDEVKEEERKKRKENFDKLMSNFEQPARKKPKVSTEVREQKEEKKYVQKSDWTAPKLEKDIRNETLEHRTVGRKKWKEDPGLSGPSSASSWNYEGGGDKSGLVGIELGLVGRQMEKFGGTNQGLGDGAPRKTSFPTKIQPERR